MKNRNRELAEDFVLGLLGRMSSYTQEDYKACQDIIENIDKNKCFLPLMDYISNKEFMKPYMVNNKEQLKEADDRLRKLIHKIKEITESEEFLNN